MAITKICPNCENEFQTYPSINSQCCSRKCSNELIKKQTYEKYKCRCEVCEKEFLPPRPAEGGRFCSYTCRGIANRKKRVDRNGYWYVCVPEHPAASAQGYVAEHRLIMEKHLGRYLTISEVVHHIDGDRKNNVIENLQVMSDSEHKSHHMIEQHNRGLMCTVGQRKRASERMKASNPSKNIRGYDGRFVKEGS